MCTPSDGTLASIGTAFIHGDFIITLNRTPLISVSNLLSSGMCDIFLRFTIINVHASGRVRKEVKMPSLDD